ncbi:hypothetical protein [Phyllobacterium sp. SB3]|uniref:hypothetical protein n=1 Tax=Phyllobacterium sp. SB3 TaxID=3156073 RepID=UPI0032B00513
MIISSRRERQLSIVATALLTAAIFVMPIKTPKVETTRVELTGFVKIADATPVKLTVRK